MAGKYSTHTELEIYNGYINTYRFSDISHYIDYMKLLDIEQDVYKGRISKEIGEYRKSEVIQDARKLYDEYNYYSNKLNYNRSSEYFFSNLIEWSQKRYSALIIGEKYWNDYIHHIDLMESKNVYLEDINYNGE